jgi:predicted aspartyl protease
MYPYDRQMNPPAPTVPVKILPPSGVSADPITLNVLADTGADSTCLPLNIFSALNLLPNGTIRVAGATGPAQCNLYSVDIEFHNQLFPSCTIVELPLGFQPLLGRDIMKTFRLEFNGPSGYLAIL